MDSSNDGCKMEVIFLTLSSKMLVLTDHLKPK